MDINDLYNAGGDIMNAVNDAVNRNDYSGLNESLKKTVKDVSDMIQRDVRQYNAQNQREDIRSRRYYSTQGQGGPRDYDQDPYGRYRSGSAPQFGQRMNSAQQLRRRVSPQKTPFLQKIVSKQSGIGKILGGVFGLFITIPMLLADLFGVVVVGMSGGALFGILATALLVAACAYAVVSGRKDNALIKRYYQYAQVIGDAEYVEIAKLAKKTGMTKEDVLADIKKLMDKKILTEAWLDEQETTLMLTEEVYNQYQQMREQSRVLRQQAEEEQASDADLPENARAIIKEGKEYIKTIHDLNDEIPGVEMSEKLYRLESTMDRIVEQVRQNPSSAPELRKLMSYYLPTTVKLLNAYKELDRQTVNGENISTTKKEIEDALDTINDAFEKLLDSLFQNMAWDVSSDISVMQTMLAQDGLTGEHMSAESGQSVEQMENQVYGTTLTWGDEGGAMAQGQYQYQEEKK